MPLRLKPLVMNVSNELSPPARAPAEPGALRAVAAWFDARPWLLPLVSFVAGWGGYLLVERGPALAQGIALVALCTWPWMLVDNLLGRWLEAWSKGVLSHRLTAFVTQSVQQEMLFFALPFVIGALRPNFGHALFAAVIGLAALFSTIDPLYHRWVEKPAISVAFQGFCTFVLALVVLPVALHVPVEQAVPYSVAIALVSLLAGLPRLLQPGGGKARSFAVIATAALSLGSALVLRPWVPPVGLHMTESRITQSITRLAPGPEAKTISLAQANAQGVIAYVAIHAPEALTQKLRFDWHHEGVSVERIPASIEGAGGRGWRTYTRKQNFASGCGRWRVDVRTPGDQLVGRLYFRISCD